ncbi:MAG: flagellar basal body-associated FliL family protein [Pseudomonadota bacterium]
MLNKILPIVITLVAVGGAGFAAMTLKGGPAPAAPSAKADGHGDGHGNVKEVQGEEKGSGFGYFNFRRNFIVPVVGSSRVEALILISVSIEMEEEKIEEAQLREPNIRDAFMKSLLAMSHEGMFNQDITNPDVYSEIQKRLMETAKVSIDQNVKSVLLVDFARQDQ